MRLIRRFRFWLQRSQRERELAEEIEFHRSLAGPREMGNVTRAREDARAVWTWPWLQSVAQDLRYALRGLRREPGFTLVALLALGTAIGLNTSLFTIFNSIALRGWNVHDPQGMVRIFTQSARPVDGVDGLTGMGVAEIRYIAARTQAFTGLTLNNTQRWVRFGHESFGQISQVFVVAANHFRTLGLDPHLGRGFLPEEDRVDAPQAVIVLSYALWRDRFSADPAILGRQVSVNAIPFTVVGVGPRNFTGLEDREDAWIPLASTLILNPESRGWLTNPNACCEELAGRLAAGVSREQARSELDVLSGEFRASRSDPRRARFVITAANMLAGDPDDAAQATRLFAVLFLGVTLVVLLACANVGNLLVARAAARRREIEVRRAVGAGRARIVRQLLTESLVLALGAGAIGVVLAFEIPRFVVSQVDPGTAFRLTPDGTVLVYALTLAVFACLSFGLAPALHGTKIRPAGAPLRLRNLLLAAQVALSVVLLIGAGLMLEGVRRAATRDLGFAINGVTVTAFELPPARLSPERLRALRTRLFDEIRRLADGEPFAMVLRVPLGGLVTSSYRLPDEPQERFRRAYHEEVSPGYFDTLRIPLVAGRDFEAGDLDRNVAIVNETMARDWDGDAVGKTVIVGRIPRQIIGVARDAYTVRVDNVEPMFYQPFREAQLPQVLVRSSSPRFAAAIEAAVTGVEPGMRARTLPLSERLDRALAPSRIGAQLAGVLGVFALALATVGMFGVFAYAVQQRTREIGIRMALGAMPGQVVQLVLAGSSRAMLGGLVAGFLLAAAASRLIAGYIFGVSPLDARTYTLVGAVLALAALAASYLPARRAARIDPSTALRHE